MKVGLLRRMQLEGLFDDARATVLANAAVHCIPQQVAVFQGGTHAAPKFPSLISISRCTAGTRASKLRESHASHTTELTCRRSRALIGPATRRDAV